MTSVVETLEASQEFHRIWRLPFEKENPVSIQYVLQYLTDILGGDMSMAQTASGYVFFDLHGSPVTESNRDALFKDPLPLLHQPEKVYLVMGADVFRYITIEYTSNGLGILSDYQLSA